MTSAYPKKIEEQMQELYSRLPEKSRRLYAGIEALKKSAGGHVNRNAEFTRITELKAAYEAQDNPVVSVDTKKQDLKNLCASFLIST